ncbi:hypothetical protein [Thermoactinomyces daqus]|nr:hypothetical protein [Thermoactinomyces daqus]
MAGLTWGGGIVVLFAIVVLGILFDMLGIAAAAAKEKPFHAMAAKKIPGAKESIGIVRRADQFSSFCNDVVGDISGVISGSASFAVAASLIATFPQWGKQKWLIDVVLVSVISALTVGGESVGQNRCHSLCKRNHLSSGNCILLGKPKTSSLLVSCEIEQEKKAKARRFTCSSNELIRRIN